MHPHHTTRESILARLDRSGACWLWPGYTNTPGGYGRIWYQGRHHLVHRLVYEFLVGPIPDGHELHHRCETLRCANPDHLQAVTKRDHRVHLSTGCIAYQHAHATTCKHGHPLEGENLALLVRKGRTVRACRACWRLHYVRWRARQPVRLPKRPGPKPAPPRPPRTNEVASLPDGTCVVVLTRGRVALIDADDWPAVRTHLWHAHLGGRRWYARAKIGAEYLTLQRFLLQPPPELGVRVRNGDSLDCRRANLYLGPRVGGFNRGPRNGQWKGAAASDYGMHQRAVRAFRLPALCEVCGTARAIDRHHRDGDSSNNNPQNILCCCRRCHMTLDGRLEQMRAACERWNAQRR